MYFDSLSKHHLFLISLFWIRYILAWHAVWEGLYKNYWTKFDMSLTQLFKHNNREYEVRSKLASLIEETPFSEKWHTAYILKDLRNFFYTNYPEPMPWVKQMSEFNEFILNRIVNVDSITVWKNFFWNDISWPSKDLRHMWLRTLDTEIHYNNVFFESLLQNFKILNNFEFFKNWDGNFSIEHNKAFPFHIHNFFLEKYSYAVFESHYLKHMVLSRCSFTTLNFEIDILLVCLGIFFFCYSIYILMMKGKAIYRLSEAFDYSIGGFALILFLLIWDVVKDRFDPFWASYAFNFSYYNDFWVWLMRIIISCFVVLSLILLKQFLKSSKHTMIELYLLINLSSILSIIVLSITNIFAILIILEIFSFIIISFIIVEPSQANIKAAKQYFAYNSIVAAISMLGIFGIFFITKSFQFFLCCEIFQLISLYGSLKLKFFICIVLSLWSCSFLFKLGIFPFNAYIPAMFESLSLPFMFFLNSTIKLSIFFIVLKIINKLSILYFVKDFLLILSLLSLLLSAILVLNSTKLKRFFGLTSINFNSFLLICLLSNSTELIALIIVYIILYNFAMFFVVGVFMTFNLKEQEQQITFPDLKIILRGRFFCKFVLTLCLLLISGLPPLPIFLFKYLIFVNLLWQNVYVFVSFIVFVNIVSFYYYLKVLQCIWVKEDLKDLQKFNKNKTFLFAEAEDFFTNLIRIGFYLFLLTLYITLINFDDILSILEFSIETLKDNTYIKVNLPFFEDCSVHSRYINFCAIFMVRKSFIKTPDTNLVNSIIYTKHSTHDLLILNNYQFFNIIKYKPQK